MKIRLFFMQNFIIVHYCTLMYIIAHYCTFIAINVAEIAINVTGIIACNYNTVD